MPDKLQNRMADHRGDLSGVNWQTGSLCLQLFVAISLSIGGSAAFARKTGATSATPENDLATLNPTVGEYPYDALVLGTDGNFYGTAHEGGTSNFGTVFSMAPSGAITVLHSFGGPYASYPTTSLVEGTDGDFYGTTSTGGKALGSVFKITTGGKFTTLYSFSAAGANGHEPMAALVEGRDGDFYGTTDVGGKGGGGTIFKITSRGKLTTLYSFLGSSDGARPESTLVKDADGNFYGTTTYAGASGKGTIFRVTPQGSLTTLYSFDGTDDIGTSAAMVLSTDGNFYGTAGTDQSESSGGSFFMITPSGAFTTLYTFAPSMGPGSAGVVQGADGNFYGVAGGGDNACGTIYQITSSGVLTNLFSFDNEANGGGCGPIGTLIQAPDGDFYGTTIGGGVGYGVVYEFSLIQ